MSSVLIAGDAHPGLARAAAELAGVRGLAATDSVGPVRDPRIQVVSIASLLAKAS